MDPTYIAEKKYEAFADAIKRYRWFVLINILLSCAALANVYLEHGFTEAQTRQVFERSVLGAKSPSNVKMNELTTRILTQTKEQLSTPEGQLLLAAAVELKMQLVRGDSMITAVSLRDRKIPLLELDVPWNDYIVVVAMMMTVFVIATWLSCVTVRGQIKGLRLLFPTTPDLKSLVKFNFFFTSPDEKGWTRTIVHRLAILLPVLVFVVSGAVDFLPAIGTLSQGGLQTIYLVRLCFYFACLLIMVPFCVETLKCSNEINELVD